MHQHLTITAAAGQMGVSRDVVRGLIDAGEIAYVQFGPRRRIPANALAAYIEAHTYPLTDLGG